MRVSQVLLSLVLASCSAAQPAKVVTLPAAASSELSLSEALVLLERQLGTGTLAVAIKDLETGQVDGINLDRPMPMQSVFKAALGAAVFADIDAGRLSLTHEIDLSESDLAPPFSPIADAWPGRKRYNVEELLEAAVGGSDNTAADVLIGLIGGPEKITSFLRSKGIRSVRVDRTERQLQTEAVGLGKFRREWRGEEAWANAMNEIPEPARRVALHRYLKDPRDTATPRGTIDFLEKLQAEQLLSSESTRQLMKIMTETPTGANRLKAGLPPGATIAHKTGTGRRVLGVATSVNDAGIIKMNDGRVFAIVVYVAGTTESDDKIETVHAMVATLAAR